MDDGVRLRGVSLDQTRGRVPSLDVDEVPERNESHSIDCFREAILKGDADIVGVHDAMGGGEEVFPPADRWWETVIPKEWQRDFFSYHTVRATQEEGRWSLTVPCDQVSDQIDTLWDGFHLETVHLWTVVLVIRRCRVGIEMSWDESQTQGLSNIHLSFNGVTGGGLRLGRGGKIILKEDFLNGQRFGKLWFDFLGEEFVQRNELLAHDRLSAFGAMVEEDHQASRAIFRGLDLGGSSQVCDVMFIDVDVEGTVDWELCDHVLAWREESAQRGSGRGGVTHLPR
jgi:hypothetical protein